MNTHIIEQPARSVPHQERQVIYSFRVPDDHPPTHNELAWVEMLRTIVGDRDPPPSLPAAQALRRALMEM